MELGAAWRVDPPRLRGDGSGVRRLAKVVGGVAGLEACSLGDWSGGAHRRPRHVDEGGDGSAAGALR